MKKPTKKQLKKLEMREIKKKDKEWREKVLARDNNQCQYCGRKEFLDCHHILPRELTAYRWVLENGIVLCKKHHRFSFEFSSHQSSFLFFLWFMKNKKEQYNKLLKLIK